MSHFSCLVIGEVENQLLPFCENTDRCPNEYLEFEDVEDKYLKEYKEETRREFYCSSSSSRGMEVTEENYNVLRARNIGDFVGLCVSAISVNYYKLNKYYHCGFSKDRKRPENQIWVKVTRIIHTDHPDRDVCFKGVIEVQLVEPPREIRHIDKYNSFEEFMEDWAGYSARNEEYNRYGYFQNPKAKWDWYEIGGRFAGKLLLKKSGAKSYKAPNFSWGWAEEDKNKALSGLFVDAAKAGEVDWLAMKEKAEQEAAAQYDKVIATVGIPKHKTWEEVRNEYSDIDEAREFYRNQEQVKEYSKVDAWSDLDGFKTDKETYIKKNSNIATFAALKDNQWFERGNMGWWGIVSDEQDRESWNNKFIELVMGLGPEVQVTVVDCHI